MAERWHPRRIAHLTTVDLSLRHLVFAQLAAARDSGAEVIGISATGPDVAWLEERGIRHIGLAGSTRSFNLRGDARAAVSLVRILRAERPDVLHTHNPKPGWYGRVVGRLAGVPVVVNTVHGLYATEDDPPAKRAVVYALEAGASRFSDAELVQNPEDLDLLVRTRFSPPDKTSLLGNGVDLRRFRPPMPGERAQVRAELGLADDDVAIGFVGRLVAEKGLPELLEAVAGVPGIRPIIIGPADVEKADAMGAGVMDSARRDGVEFLGHRDDVDRLYRGLDVFVLPSHREGFPRAAMEAAASGLAVIAADVRGCRQVVADGQTGLLVPVRDPAALRTAIERMCDDPDERVRMGSQSRLRAEAHFDEDTVVERVMAAYPLARQRRCARVDRAKRAMDVAVALTGLVVLAPVMAAVAGAVQYRLGAPVLFRQVRPGRDGRLFTMYKFRTMGDERGSDGTLLPDEQRLGTFGSVLRSTSLDELPELWNVLKGDMGIVGPRPLLVHYLDHYSPRQARRHEVRPGITGLAQISGRNAQTWEDRLDLDVSYVDRRSLVLDLEILVRTVGAVLRRDGISEAGSVTKAAFVAEDRP